MKSIYGNSVQADMDLLGRYDELELSDLTDVRDDTVGGASTPVCAAAIGAGAAIYVATLNNGNCPTAACTDKCR